MKTERGQLEHYLRLTIEENALNTKVHDQVKEFFKQKNISPGEVAAMLTQQIPLETLDGVILYLLTKGLYQATGTEILNPTRWFTDIEIKEAEKYKKENEEVLDGDLIFENVLQVEEDQWVTVLTSQKIKQLYNSFRVFYRPETQRGMVSYRSGNSIIKRIDVNIRVVNNIAKKLIDGSFITNTITFNVLKDGNDNIEYNPDNMSLIIGKESEIDVVDGFHRSYAILKALITKPNLNKNWEVRIVNWDIDKAQRFIYQESLQTPLKKSRQEELNQSKLENQIVKNLNEMARNELQYKITTDYLLIKNNSAYVMFDDLSDAIKEVFTIKSQRDVKKITKFLIEFFNELVGIYSDEFTNLKSSKEKCYITHPNMFIGYVALASKLKGKNNWEDELEDILSKIDFSKSNKIWSQLNIDKPRLSKRQKLYIINYFSNLVN